MSARASHGAAGAGGPPEVWGLVAEFGSEHELVEGARRVREAGYTRTDAFMPYPSHEVIEALGVRRSKVPLVILIGAALGALLGYSFQYWVSAVAYPLNVGGRPLHSWVSFIVVTFELMILFGAISGVVGMLALNRLPQPYHPVFNSAAFRAAASVDGFFLAIEAEDERFDRRETAVLLKRSGAIRITEVAP